MLTYVKRKKPKICIFNLIISFFKVKLTEGTSLKKIVMTLCSRNANFDYNEN